MVEIKNIRFLFAVLWLIILIGLWIIFPFMPGNTLAWMWLAISWSILGLFVISIYLMTKGIKYVILIGFLWLVVLVLLIVDATITHLIYIVSVLIFFWIITGVLLIITIILLRKMNKTEW